jgi:hypothetical protein
MDKKGMRGEAGKMKVERKKSVKVKSLRCKKLFTANPKPENGLN